jgi:hypothetical protein
VAEFASGGDERFKASYVPAFTDAVCEQDGDLLCNAGQKQVGTDGGRVACFSSRDAEAVFEMVD